jgi:hypothetical protein
MHLKKHMLAKVAAMRPLLEVSHHVRVTAQKMEALLNGGLLEQKSTRGTKHIRWAGNKCTRDHSALDTVNEPRKEACGDDHTPVTQQQRAEGTERLIPHELARARTRTRACLFSVKTGAYGCCAAGNGLRARSPTLRQASRVHTSEAAVPQARPLAARTV